MDWQTAVRIATGVLRRRKRLAVVVSLLALAALLAPAYHLSRERPRFTTTATIFVEVRPSRMPIFQEVAPGRPLSVQLAILSSRTLAESVLDTLPPESVEDLQEKVSDANPVTMVLDVVDRARRLIIEQPDLAGRDEPEPVDPRARKVAELRRRMTFTSTGEGIVTITTEASKPHVAVAIANAYVEVLLARTRSFNQDDARVSREFLEQQLAEVQKRLQINEQRLQRMVASHGGVGVPDRSRAAVADLSATERSLAEVETNRKMVQTRLQALREKVELQKRTPVTSPSPVPAAPAAPPPPPAREVQRLRDQLARLEVALLDLRSRYTDAHPRVILTKERLAELQRELALVVRETTPATPAPSAVPPAERRDFSAQLVALETAFHTLTAQEEALRNQATQLRQSLTGLSRDELDYSRAVREVDSARHVFALISDKLTAARIGEQGEMKVVKIIDPAGPARPAAALKRLILLAFAACVALAIGGGVPAAVEWTRRTVENEDDVVDATGLPVLASLPRLRSRRPVFVSGIHEEARPLGADFVFTEAFHSLRVAVQFSMRSENIRTLLVTSALSGEGKSTVVLNLAHAFQEAGQAVVVADADFYRPVLHRTLTTAPGAGFLDALDSGAEGVKEALVPVEENLWLVPRGSAITPRTRQALTTDRVRTLFHRLSAQATLVLCDSSPVLLVPETLFLASSVDGVLLVAKAGATGRRELARAKAALDGAGARVIGVVLNEVPPSTLRHTYDRYYAQNRRNGHAS